MPERRGRGRPKLIPREAPYRMVRRDFLENRHWYATDAPWEVEVIFLGLLLSADDHGRGLVSDLSKRMSQRFDLASRVDQEAVERRCVGQSNVPSAVVRAPRKWRRDVVKFLSCRGLVYFYRVGSDEVYQIVSWFQHQRLPNPKDSTWPPPDVEEMDEFLQGKIPE